jgi:hypothetical protein
MAEASGHSSTSRVLIGVRGWPIDSAEADMQARSKRKWVAAALATAVVSGAVVSGAAPGTTARASAITPTRATVLVNPTRPVGVPARMPRTLIITDSTGAFIRWEAKNAPTFQQLDPLNVGGSWEFRGESCRAISITSCHGREGYAPPNVLDELATIQVGEFDELTLMVGYNEGAENMKLGIEAVLTAARAKGIDHVSWLNFCTCSAYVGPASMGNKAGTYGTRNDYLISSAKASNGYLSIIDWGSLNYADPSLTLDDRSHLTAAGAVTVAALMAQSIEMVWLGTASSSVAKLARTQTTAATGRFTGVTPPIRLLDTRTGVGGPNGPRFVLAGEAVRVQVPVPLATGAVVNVTAVAPYDDGYLTAYPCTGALPQTSFANFTDGQTVANSTTVKLDADGGFCLFSSATTNLAVDLYGTLSNSGSGFVPTAPQRLLDTRNTGRPPRGTSAVKLMSTSLNGNLTVVNGTEGFATVWPGTGDGSCRNRPTTSVLNWSSAGAVANRVDIEAPARELCVFVSSDADVLVDGYGSYESSAAATGSSLTVAAPTRLFDSRSGSKPLATYSIPIADRSKPTLSVNLVAIGSADGFTTIWSAPKCDKAPATSVVNQVAGVARANSVIVPTDAMLCIFASAPVHVMVDLA